MFLPLVTAAAATLADFEAVLNEQDSATAALRRWCEVRRIANPADIRAVRVSGPEIRPPSDLRDLLGFGETEQVAFRHVRLQCDGTVLSEAFNWYVPSRLTPEMNARLDTGNAPFGTVVAPLKFRRERLNDDALQGNFCPAGTILAKRARLVLPNGEPIAVLIECYSAANLTAGN